MLTGSGLCGSVAMRGRRSRGTDRPLPLLDLPQDPWGCVFDGHASAAAVLSLAAGEELLLSFEPSRGKLRRFCTRCGSHIVADRPKLHMRCSEGASWYDPGDVLPEF